MKTLGLIEEVFGKEHQVYIGIELSKKFERHYRDEVGNLIKQISEEYEGRDKMKGELTIVISPHSFAEDNRKSFKENVGNMDFDT